MIFEVGSLYVSFILQAKRERETWPLACWTRPCPICLRWGRPKKWLLSVIQMHESHYLQWELTCTFLDSLIFPGQNYGTMVGSPQPFCVLWSPHLAGWRADKAWAVSIPIARVSLQCFNTSWNYQLPGWYFSDLVSYPRMDFYYFVFIFESLSKQGLGCLRYLGLGECFMISGRNNLCLFLTVPVLKLLWIESWKANNVRQGL